MIDIGIRNASRVGRWHYSLPGKSKVLARSFIAYK